MPQDSLRVFIIDTLHLAGSNTKQFPTKDLHDEQLFGLNKDYATLILIPIFSFLLALLFNWLREKIKLKSQLKERQEYLFTWVDLIAPQIRRQVELLSQYSEKLKMENPGSLMFGLVDLHFEKLRVISSIELVRLFVTNKKTNQTVSNNLLFKWENSISLLEKKRQNILDCFESFKGRNLSSTKEWNEWMAKLHESYIIFIQSQITDDATSNDANIIQITSQYQKWSGVKSQQRKQTKELFLDPVESFCISFRKEKPKNEEIIPFITANTTLKRLCLEKESSDKRYSELFSQYSSELLKAHNNLVETKNELREMKLKKIFALK